jgi:hypothetical protein
MKAGTLSPVEFAMIMTVKGYAHKEAIHIDERRKADDVSTRKGSKKAVAVSLSPAQAPCRWPGQTIQKDGVTLF